MKEFDFVIIGCGISCLYFLKKVKQLGLDLKVAILEKKPYPGGRIHSIKIGKDIIDTGALRFTENHKILMSLLKDYGINDIEELVSKKNVKLDNDLKIKFDKFIGNCRSKKMEHFAFGEVAKSFFTQSEYDSLKLWFGYNQKWEQSSCRNLADQIANYDEKKYYHLKNGLSQLVEAMVNDLKESFSFFFGEKVKKISDGNNIYTSDNHYVGKHIIFACPPTYIKNISGTEDLGFILSAVEGQILNRIYAKFKDGSWFPKNVLHNFTPVSQTVPINDKIIMISYSTGRDAKYWIEKEMAGKLWDEISQELGGIKEKPVWIKQNYWNPGTYYYKPGFPAKETQNLSFKPLKNKDWHIIGEAYSLKQGWMEGALQNADLFLKKFIKKDLDPNLRKYSLSEVKKHNKKENAWIALFGNVYDVTKWIPIHPGGEVILYGIGKDATEMFKSVGHREDAMEFLNNYKIGILK